MCFFQYGTHIPRPADSDKIANSTHYPKVWGSLVYANRCMAKVHGPHLTWERARAEGTKMLFETKILWGRRDGNFVLVNERKGI